MNSSVARPQRIAQAFAQACREELDAPKPGNVHVFADGHRMTAADFERSAEAAAGPLAAAGARVGKRILGAVEATDAAVGANTNLGIVLLCAPLAAAAETQRQASGRQRHSQKITVYLSIGELLALERARLALRTYGIPVDRGRIVREALAVLLADLDAEGDKSLVARRLRDGGLTG